MKNMIKICAFAFTVFVCLGTVSAQTNLVLEAKNALSSGNNAKAIELYDQVIQSADKYAPTYYARGLAKYKMKNFDAAIIDFEKAGALDSTYYQAFYGLSLCYLEKADYRKVINYYQIIRELNKSFAPNYYVKGLALYHTNNIPQANIAFSQTLLFDEKYYKAIYARAICLKEMNLLDMAVKDMQNYVRLAGNQDGLEAECARLISEMQKELNK